MPSFGIRLSAQLLYLALRLLQSTWRSEPDDFEPLDNVVSHGERVLAVFWHGGYVPIFGLAAGRQAVVLVAASHRGRVIAGICRRFGYQPAIIPADRSGRSFASAAAALRGPEPLAALALDGPSGPRHVVRRRTIELAAQTGRKIVPVAVRSSRSWVARARWDRRKIPKPFSEVRLVIGSAIDPNDANAADRIRLQLQRPER